MLAEPEGGEEEANEAEEEEALGAGGGHSEEDAGEEEEDGDEVDNEEEAVRVVDPAEHAGLGHPAARHRDGVSWADLVEAEEVEEGGAPRSAGSSMVDRLMARRRSSQGSSASRGR